MCGAPCLTSSSICYWCTALPIQQSARNIYEFQHIEQLCIVLLHSPTKCHRRWASFKPSGLISLKKSVLPIGLQATPASVSLITHHLYIHYLASVFKYYGQTCLFELPITRAPSESLFLLKTLKMYEVSCKTALLCNLHLHSEGSVFIPFFWDFCSNTCSMCEGALNLSAFLFISECTAVDTLKAKAFLPQSNAIALSVRPWECESMNYKLMAERAARKDSGW